jgi:hypothetical protein
VAKRLLELMNSALAEAAGTGGPAREDL